MNKLALTLVLLGTAAAPALAVESIGIYADQAGTNCEVSDPGGNALVSLYVVHTIQVGSWVGSAWKLDWDAGMTMSYIGDSTPYWHLGNALDGINISYATCQNATIMIDTVTMSSHGTSSPCSHITFGPEATLGRVQIYCNFTYHDFVPGEATVNPDNSCHCNLNPTEPSTWGRVKALYR